MIIIPSLVEQTPNDLFSLIHRLSRYYNRFQIDIEDGIFVPHKTLTTEDFVTYIRTLQKQIPTSYRYDMHLMEQEFMSSIQLLAQSDICTYIGVVFVHYFFLPDLDLLKRRYPHLTFGLVINPNEQIKTVNASYVLNKFSHIQLMTVNPGPQGQPFIKDSLNKIEQLRSAGYKGKIYIDGAINDYTIPLIRNSAFLPDVLCPGSFLAKTDLLDERVSYLRNAFDI